MALTNASTYYEVAAPPARKGGILDLAQVHDVTDPHLLMGVRVESLLCSPAHSWDAICDMNPSVPKVVTNTAISSADPFAVYDLVECGSFGGDWLSAKAAEAFALKESVAVENHLRDYFVANGTAVAGGVAADPIVTVSELDLWLITNYAGQGLLHMGPVAATRAFSNRALYEKDGRLYSPSGTPVVVGGYNVAGSTVYAFASGNVTVLRGSIVKADVPILRDGTTTENVGLALVERPYVTLVECGSAKAIMGAHV